MSGAAIRGIVRCTLRWTSRLVNAWRLRNLPSHQHAVARSRRVLRTIRSFDEPHRAARAFAYLRQVEPLVFEETVLSALEDAGALVLRNRRYSGDGGIDGRYWLPALGLHFAPVQAKRYQQHISVAHVANFAWTVARGASWVGLFVHCGRTGARSHTACRRTGVVIVGGDRLISLLVQRRLPPIFDTASKGDGSWPASASAPFRVPIGMGGSGFVASEVARTRVERSRRGGSGASR